MAIPDSKKIYPREGDETLVLLSHKEPDSHIKVNILGEL